MENLLESFTFYFTAYYKMKIPIEISIDFNSGTNKSLGSYVRGYQDVIKSHESTGNDNHSLSLPTTHQHQQLESMSEVAHGN
jgi:hypothetical protein